MLKQYASLIRRLLTVSDAALIGFAFLLAYYARRHWFAGLFYYDVYFIKAYIWILPTVLLPWCVLMYFFGMYDSFRLKKMGDICWIVIKSALICFLAFAALSYILKIEHISRSFVVLFFVFSALLLIVEKMVIMVMFRVLRRRGFNFRNILIIGTGPRAQQFMRYLNKHSELGLKIIGLLDEDKNLSGTNVLGYKVLGTIDHISGILREYVIDHAIFIVPRKSLERIEPALLQCELVGVTASVSLDLFNLKFTCGKETSFMGIPMVSFERASHSISALFFKRLFDWFVSGLALLILSPLYVAVALLVKLTSPGPVYFSQERVGLNGRTFKLYKFRTMVRDAEHKLEQLLVYNEMKGPVFKIQEDPRVTPLGKILRKYSLDELPQLWNVFTGDMSLVGPRPPLPREVKQYDPWHQRRLSMRPGITCFWQVNGRNRISDFDEWVKMDLDYIDNWSFILDIKILFKTIPAVLSTSGAA